MAWASISTAPSSPTPGRPTVSPCRSRDEGIAAVLGGPRHRLPQDRREVRAGAWLALRHQCLDSRRLQGHPGGPLTPRTILKRSLDEIFAEKLDPRYHLDAVESKLFGIGSESYVVGSHEFYLGYAIANQKLVCLDAGHFHPTEGIADKISSVLTWLDEILLHVSRGVRWDSDHVVILSDDLRAIAEEIVRGDYLGRVHIGLDFFDASINRVGGLGDRHPRHAQGAC